MDATQIEIGFLQRYSGQLAKEIRQGKRDFNDREFLDIDSYLNSLVVPVKAKTIYDLQIAKVMWEQDAKEGQ